MRNADIIPDDPPPLMALPPPPTRQRHQFTTKPNVFGVYRVYPESPGTTSSSMPSVVAGKSPQANDKVIASPGTVESE